MSGTNHSQPNIRINHDIDELASNNVILTLDHSKQQSLTKRNRRGDDDNDDSKPFTLDGSSDDDGDVLHNEEMTKQKQNDKFLQAKKVLHAKQTIITKDYKDALAIMNGSDEDSDEGDNQQNGQDGNDENDNNDTTTTARPIKKQKGLFVQQNEHGEMEIQLKKSLQPLLNQSLNSTTTMLNIQLGTNMNSNFVTQSEYQTTAELLAEEEALALKKKKRKKPTTQSLFDDNDSTTSSTNQHNVSLQAVHDANSVLDFLPPTTLHPTNPTSSTADALLRSQGQIRTNLNQLGSKGTSNGLNTTQQRAHVGKKSDVSFINSLSNDRQDADANYLQAYNKANESNDFLFGKKTEVGGDSHSRGGPKQPMSLLSTLRQKVVGVGQKPNQQANDFLFGGVVQQTHNKQDQQFQVQVQVGVKDQQSLPIGANPTTTQPTAPSLQPTTVQPSTTSTTTSFQTILPPATNTAVQLPTQPMEAFLDEILPILDQPAVDIPSTTTTSTPPTTNQITTNNNTTTMSDDTTTSTNTPLQPQQPTITPTPPTTTTPLIKTEVTMADDIPDPIKVEQPPTATSSTTLTTINKTKAHQSNKYQTSATTTSSTEIDHRAIMNQQYRQKRYDERKAQLDLRQREKDELRSRGVPLSDLVQITTERSVFEFIKAAIDQGLIPRHKSKTPKSAKNANESDDDDDGINLEHVDEYGNKLSAKEAFKEHSRVFHGNKQNAERANKKHERLQREHEKAMQWITLPDGTKMKLPAAAGSETKSTKTESVKQLQQQVNVSRQEMRRLQQQKLQEFRQQQQQAKNDKMED